MRRLIGSAVIALTLGAASALAQASPGGAVPRQLSEQDRQFVYWATETNKASRDLAELAARKAQSPAVQDYARHGLKRADELERSFARLGKADGAAPAPRPDKDDRDLKKNLAATQGEEFDRLYMRFEILQGHKTLDLFEGEARNGHDPWLKGFVAEMLPKLQRRHREARAVLAKLPRAAPLMSPSGVVTVRQPRPGALPVE